MKTIAVDQHVGLKEQSACKANVVIQEYVDMPALQTSNALMMKYVTGEYVSQDVGRTLIVLISSPAYQGNVSIRVQDLLLVEPTPYAHQKITNQYVCARKPLLEIRNQYVDVSHHSVMQTKVVPRALLVMETLVIQPVEGMCKF